MDPLDHFLSSYAREPLPSPKDVSRDVWLEINGRRAQGNAAFGWGKFLAQPQLAFAGLLLAVLIGGAPSIFRELQDSRLELARKTLHMEIFSARSSALQGSIFRSSAFTAPRK